MPVNRSTAISSANRRHLSVPHVLWSIPAILCTILAKSCWYAVKKLLTHSLTCTIVCNHTVVTVCAIYLIYTYQNTCRLAPITVFHNAVQLVLHKILQPFVIVLILTCTFLGCPCPLLWCLQFQVTNHRRCCGQTALGQCRNTRSVSDGRLTQGDVDIDILSDQSPEMLWSASTRGVLEHSECVGRAFDMNRRWRWCRNDGTDTRRASLLCHPRIVLVDGRIRVPQFVCKLLLSSSSSSSSSGCEGSFLRGSLGHSLV